MAVLWTSRDIAGRPFTLVATAALCSLLRVQAQQARALRDAEAALRAAQDDKRRMESQVSALTEQLNVRACLALLLSATTLVTCGALVARPL